jgi:hypothetical protein
MERTLVVKFLIDDKSYTKNYVTDKDTLEEARQAVTDELLKYRPTAIVYEITE